MNNLRLEHNPILALAFIVLIISIMSLIMILTMSMIIGMSVKALLISFFLIYLILGIISIFFIGEGGGIYGIQDL